MVDLPPHIWYQYARIDEIDLGTAVHILSESERHYLETVTNEKRRVEFTAGRIAARTHAAALLHVAPERIPLEITPEGALDLTNTPYSISIAHSHARVCTAMGEGVDIGVDVEMIKPRNPDVYRFILNPDEYYLLEALPFDRQHALILCWVLKEATLKGMRTGFRCSPKKLQLRIDAERSMATIETEADGTWSAHFEQRDEAYIAVAYRQNAL